MATEKCIIGLEQESGEELNRVLRNFIETHNKTFTFSDLDAEGKRRKIWTLLFIHLGNSNQYACHKYCLSCVRILSRDKTALNDLICDDWLEIILNHARLLSHEEALTQINKPLVDYNIVLEALKSLCNIVYNSTVAQVLCSKNHLIEGIILRLRTYRDCNLPQEIKLFDMKLLFLITALAAEVRPKLKEDLHGVTYLVEILDLILKEAGDEERGASHANKYIILSDVQVSITSEILKVLFNLTVKSEEMPSDEEDDNGDTFVQLRLMSILHNFLLCGTESPEKQGELRTNAVNLIMTIPTSCYSELYTPVLEDSPVWPKDMEYEGKNMEAMAVLLDFLNDRLDCAAQARKIKEQLEYLTAILTVLLNCARSQRLLRKWLRMQILPPLSEVHARPEEGNSLRNKLCRLLTSPTTQLCSLASDLLFVLCKESVPRMVKYTGYGNAAGLLVNRGLMLGQKTASVYSSESEDSDTEEYKKHRDLINPITGRVEPPHENPAASMTEEQKEHEAMKLVNMMDKLARDGIVQPCRIGEDGRPEPVEHVLQLMESHPVSKEG